MKALPVMWANIRRHKTRMLLTALSSALSFAVVGLVIAIHTSFTTGFAAGSAKHLVSMNRMAPFMPLPVAHAHDIEAIDGVVTVGFDSSFRGYFRDRRNQFTVVGVREQTFFEIAADDIIVDPSVRQAWLRSRSAALVSDSLARRFGWKPGDRVPVLSDIRRMDGSTTWEIDIAGLYRARDGTERQAVYVQYTYINEARLTDKNSVNSFDVLVRSPEQAAAISTTIDARFANSSPPTRTAPLSVILQDILRQIGDINFIMAAVATVVFLGMLLIAATVMIGNAREGLTEYAMLWVLGYNRRQLVSIALLESLLVTLTGSALGIWLAAVLVRILREPLQDVLSGLGIPALGFFVLGALAVLFGLLSGTWPALMAGRLQVADALRSK